MTKSTFLSPVLALPLSRGRFHFVNNPVISRTLSSVPLPKSIPHKYLFPHYRNLPISPCRLLAITFQKPVMAFIYFLKKKKKKKGGGTKANSLKAMFYRVLPSNRREMEQLLSHPFSFSPPYREHAQHHSCTTENTCDGNSS